MVSMVFIMHKYLLMFFFWTMGKQPLYCFKVNGWKQGKIDGSLFCVKKNTSSHEKILMCFLLFFVLWFENVKKCIGVSGDHGLNNVVPIVIGPSSFAFLVSATCGILMKIL